MYHVELNNLTNNEVIVKEVQVKGKAPKARGSFAACIIENDMYIYGGTNSDVIFDDMWCYNFESQTWKEIVKSSKD
jgi:hypothetical protein